MRNKNRLDLRFPPTSAGWTIKVVICCGLLLLGLTVFAQKSDYVGQEKRSIKALAAEDVQGYLEGRGMGMAKAAELNGYPGPMHVLQMKEALKLTPAQEVKIQAVFKIMKREAMLLGKELISVEASLEREFRGGKANAERVADLTAMIGAIQAKLRACQSERSCGNKAAPIFSPDPRL